MDRPFADKRPLGPFAQIDGRPNTELIEFGLHPHGRSFETDASRVEAVLRNYDVRADVVEDSDGVYVVKVREDMSMGQLQDFVEWVDENMMLDKSKSILLAPRRGVI